MQVGVPPPHPLILNWITPEKPLLLDWEFWLAILTGALAVATFLLALETRGLRADSLKSIKNAELQLTAMLQPIPEIAFLVTTDGALSGFGQTAIYHQDGIFKIDNKGTAAFKIKHIHVVVQSSEYIETNRVQYEVELRHYQGRIIAPHENVQDGVSVDLKKRDDKDCLFGLHLQCSDLGDISRHSFFWHPKHGMRHQNGFI